MFCKSWILISCELVLSPLLDVSLLNAELKAGRPLSDELDPGRNAISVLRLMIKGSPSLCCVDYLHSFIKLSDLPIMIFGKVKIEATSLVAICQFPRAAESPVPRSLRTFN